MRLKLGLVFLLATLAGSIPTLANSPQCEPGPETLAAVSTHVILGTPIEVDLNKADDMFYLRIKWRVDEALRHKDGLIKMAVGTELWVETSCIDLAPQDHLADASRGYCPGGQGIGMRGVLGSSDYKPGPQQVTYLGTKSISPLDSKEIYADVSNLPFSTCSDRPVKDEASALRLSQKPTQPVAPKPKSGGCR